MFRDLEIFNIKYFSYVKVLLNTIPFYYYSLLTKLPS